MTLGTTHMNLETVCTVTKKQILCESTSMRNPNYLYSQNQKGELRLPQAWGTGQGGQCLLMRKSSRVLLHNTVKILTPWDGVLNLG